MNIEQWRIIDEFREMGQFNIDRAFHFNPSYLYGSFGKVMLDAYLICPDLFGEPWRLNIWVDKISDIEPESFFLMKCHLEMPAESAAKIPDYETSNDYLFSFLIVIEETYLVM